MKFLYIANVRLPTERAHGLQIMKMCGEFAKLADVELVLPRRLNPIKDDPFVYYGVNKNFKITRLPVLDLVKFGRFGFWLESLIFSKIAALYLLFKKADIIYGRDEMPLYFLSFFKKNIFWEAHQGQINFAARRLLKKAEGVIVISSGLKDFYTGYGVESEKIAVLPDATDPAFFDNSLSKESCRGKLGLPLEKRIVLYAGHLYGWKGVYVLLDSSRGFESDFLFVFIGGTANDIVNFNAQKGELKNVQVGGHVYPAQIPFWLKAADVLVLPNSAKEEISHSFTSPLKLFEYMASGTPIIASDLPSIREIVSENDVLFFKPDDAHDLADKIKYTFQNENEMRNRAMSAKQKVQSHTWSKRAENIFSFVAQRQNVSGKSDFWPAFIAGLGIAFLSLLTFKNISILDSILSASRGLFYVILALWLLAVPFGSVFGIYIAKIIGRRKPIIFQIAKYGLTGWLNVFLYAGVFNLFSWITGIASGITADFFLVAAFVATTINGFFWNKFWTFSARGGDGRKEYIKFFTVTSFTAALHIFLFHLIVTTFGAPAGIDGKIWANVAIVALIPVSFVGNFFGYRIFVFRVAKR